MNNSENSAKLERETTPTPKHAQLMDFYRQKIINKHYQRKKDKEKSRKRNLLKYISISTKRKQAYLVSFKSIANRYKVLNKFSIIENFKVRT